MKAIALSGASIGGGGVGYLQIFKGRHGVEKRYGWLLVSGDTRQKNRSVIDNEERWFEAVRILRRRACQGQRRS